MHLFSENCKGQKPSGTKRRSGADFVVVVVVLWSAQHDFQKLVQRVIGIDSMANISFAFENLDPENECF